VKCRNLLIPFLSILLALAPVLGLAPGEAQAAAGTRVAVIQSLKGTVTVKKAGGSKEFKAFAKMSLNEGDVLKTGKDSSAVLQFSNGSAADDRMTVAANTTLTFSKLSDKSGTRTKVSMWNGSAWVDVKSIATPKDEFTLETPTAVMGVRGTHLMVSVDPVTGATQLTVVAGVVNAQPAGGGEPLEVKPGDSALLAQDAAGSGEVIIAPADLDLLMQQSDSTIVEAIVAAAAEIVLENQEKMERYLEGADGAAELERMRSNIESLLGAIVDSAIRNGVITEERARELIAEAEAQTGVTVDLTKNTLTLTDEERARQEEQKRRQEELRSQAESERQAKEAERRQNETLMRALEEARRAKEEANRKAEEELLQSAEAAYLAQLSDEERQRFEQDRSLLAAVDGQAPAGMPSAGGSGSESSGGSGEGSSGDFVIPDKPMDDAWVAVMERMPVFTAQGQTLTSQLVEKVEYYYADYDYIYTYRTFAGAGAAEVQLELDFKDFLEVTSYNNNSLVYYPDVKIVTGYDYDPYSGYSYPVYKETTLINKNEDEKRYTFNIPLESAYTLVEATFNAYGYDPGEDIDRFEEDLIRIVIVRGTPAPVDLGFADFTVGYFDEPPGYFPVLLTGDEIFAMAGKDAKNRDLFTMAQMNSIYATYNVRPQGWPKDQKLHNSGLDTYVLSWEENGEWHGYDDGLYRLEVEVTDLARLFPAKTYTMYLWRGSEVPASFAGVELESPQSLIKNTDEREPNLYYIEAADPDVTSIQISPVSPGSLTLQGVYGSDGTPLTANQGYYSIDPEGGGIWAVYTNSDNEKFAYAIVVLPNVSLEFVNVEESDGTDIGIAYVNGADEFYFAVPENVTVVMLTPTFKNDQSIYKVSVNGENVDYWAGSRESINVNYDTTKLVEITIETMAKAKTYKLHLTNEPVLCMGKNDTSLPAGLNCVTARYGFGTPDNFINWVPLDGGTEQQQSYFAYLPEDAQAVLFSFETDANLVQPHPVLTTSLHDNVCVIYDPSSICMDTVPNGEHWFKLTYTINDGGFLKDYEITFYVLVGKFFGEISYNGQPFHEQDLYYYYPIPAYRFFGMVDASDVTLDLYPDFPANDLNVSVFKNTSGQLDLYNNRIELNGLWYGMNSFEIYVEDRLGRTDKEYYLDVWRGSDIDIKIEYTVTGSVYTIDVDDLPLSGEQAGFWKQFSSLTLAHEKEDIDELRFIIHDDPNYGFLYKLISGYAVKTAEYDPVNKHHVIVFSKEELEDFMDIEIRIEDARDYTFFYYFFYMIIPNPSG